LAGTTTLGIMVTRLVNWVLDRRSALVVEIRVNDVFNSKRLLNDLKEDMRRVVPKWEERQKLPFYPGDKYEKVFDSEKYFKIAATNNTPEKLTELTMSLDRVGGHMMQIGEQDVVEIVGRTPAGLVDLQPGRTININVLTHSLFPTVTNQSIKEAIIFSSDEHVRVRYKFPAAANVEFSMMLRRRTVFLFLGSTIMFVCGILGSILTKKP
jgi:hypothetical protein